MKIFLTFSLLCTSMIILQSCASNEVDKGLKSPCVAAEIKHDKLIDSAPCIRRPVNQAWKTSV